VRTIPGEDGADYVERLRRHIAETVLPPLRVIAPEADAVVKVYTSVRGLAPEVDGAAEELARRLTGDNGTHVVSYGTEGGIFQGAGWSTVVCGPGDIAQAHQADEYIEDSEIAAGERFVADLIERLTRE
jgi:acetylornithine deacetylase